MIETKEKILITKRQTVRGEDGYKTFSVRIKDDTVAALEALAKKSNRTRNELINILLEYGVNNCEVIDS